MAQNDGGDNQPSEEESPIKLIEYGPSNQSVLIGTNIKMPCKISDEALSRSSGGLKPEWFRNVGEHHESMGEKSFRANEFQRKTTPSDDFQSIQTEAYPSLKLGLTVLEPISVWSNWEKTWRLLRLQFKLLVSFVRLISS